MQEKKKLRIKKNTALPVELDHDDFADIDPFRTFRQTAPPNIENRRCTATFFQPSEAQKIEEEFIDSEYSVQTEQRKQQPVKKRIFSPLKKVPVQSVKIYGRKHEYLRGDYRFFEPRLMALIFLVCGLFSLIRFLADALSY